MINESLRTLADPRIAARSLFVLFGAAAAGTAVLAFRAALPRRIPAHAVLLAAAQSGFAYLVLGLAVRFAVQHHRSRLQMIVLLGVVAAVEIGRYRRGAARSRAATWLAGSVAVCLGVLAAKWALEPGALSEALLRL